MSKDISRKFSIAKQRRDVEEEKEETTFRKKWPKKISSEKIVGCIILNPLWKVTVHLYLGQAVTSREIKRNNKDTESIA